MQTRLSQLFALIETYCAARKLSESRLSTLIYGAGNRIKMLRDGGDMGSRTIESSFVWFSDNWPDGAEWPSIVPRPEPKSQSVPVASASSSTSDDSGFASTQHLS